MQAPGRGLYKPNIDDPYLLQQLHMLNDNEIVPRDADPEILLPEVTEVANRRAKLCGVIMLAFVIIGAIACGVVFGMPKSSSADGELLKGSDLRDGEDGNCIVYESFYECRDHNHMKIPSCILDVYEDLKANWVLAVDPNFDPLVSQNSCHPTNVALLAVASYQKNLSLSQKSLETIYAIYVLFFSLGGLSWYNSYGWVGSYDTIANWSGLEVNKKGEVVAFRLPKNYIKGTLPEQLTILSSLVEVDLSENHVSGSLPQDIRRLEVVRLGNNKIKGTLPISWMSSSSLRVLDLSYNLITGALPSEIGRMTQFQELLLSGNRLTSMVPPEIGQLTALSTLLLGAGNLFGPAIPKEIGKLSLLKHLDLSDNPFDAAPPPVEIFDLTALETLVLSGCRLSSTLPPEIGNLMHLTHLELAKNSLEGTLPTEIGLTKLTYLDVKLNHFTGNLPSELGLLSDCELIDLSRNKLSGSLPSNLGNLKALQAFYFSGNSFDGFIPAAICHLWDDGVLEGFGQMLVEERENCNLDAYGGADCPNRGCCRNCPDLAPAV